MSWSSRVVTTAVVSRRKAMENTTVLLKDVVVVHEVTNRARVDFPLTVGPMPNDVTCNGKQALMTMVNRYFEDVKILCQSHRRFPKHNKTLIPL